MALCALISILVTGLLSAMIKNREWLSFFFSLSASVAYDINETPQVCALDKILVRLILRTVRPARKSDGPHLQ